MNKLIILLLVIFSLSSCKDETNGKFVVIQSSVYNSTFNCYVIEPSETIKNGNGYRLYFEDSSMSVGDKIKFVYSSEETLFQIKSSKKFKKRYMYLVDVKPPHQLTPFYIVSSEPIYKTRDYLKIIKIGTNEVIKDKESTNPNKVKFN